MCQQNMNMEVLYAGECVYCVCVYMCSQIWICKFYHSNKIQCVYRVYRVCNNWRIWTLEYETKRKPHTVIVVVFGVSYRFVPQCMNIQHSQEHRTSGSFFPFHSGLFARLLHVMYTYLHSLYVHTCSWLTVCCQLKNCS